MVLTTAMRSVERVVLIFATSATVRGGTGCFGILAHRDACVPEPLSNMTTVLFARSTRKAIGVEINAAAV